MLRVAVPISLGEFRANRASDGRALEGLATAQH